MKIKRWGEIQEKEALSPSYQPPWRNTAAEKPVKV
jgi:hypothetical protein